MSKERENKMEKKVSRKSFDLKEKVVIKVGRLKGEIGVIEDYDKNNSQYTVRVIEVKGEMKEVIKDGVTRKLLAFEMGVLRKK